MTGFVEVRDVSMLFAPHLTIGDRIASLIGAPVESRTCRAVDGVSLAIEKGEALGLVGESGCGKTTLGRILTGIMTPSSGSARLDGKPVMTRGRSPQKTTTRIQMVFQDPFASLDPRMRIGDILAEGPLAHGLIGRAEASGHVAQWLAAVGLEVGFADRYPHQFSGGQRQRIAIARALAMQPEVLVCDEPVASLDVSIQAQVLNLLLRLRREFGLTMLFISHDLGVVRHVSDRVAIMYLGRIVEIGATERVYARPRHPYTSALLDSVPKLVLTDDTVVTFNPIKGELPSPYASPPGCHFHPRCPRAQSRCHVERPALCGPAGREVACHFPIEDEQRAADVPESRVTADQEAAGKSSAAKTMSTS